MPRYLLVGVLLCFTLLTSSVHAQSATTTGGTTATTTATTTRIYDPTLETDVEAQVREAFADTPVMIAIAKCESGFRQLDAYGNPLFGGSGGMVGVFQESTSIHAPIAKDLGFDITTLGGNIGFARYLYEKEGTTPWLASVGCWNPKAGSVLKLGSKGASVKELQRQLNRSGYIVALIGDGSPGKETTVFGPMTQRAVMHFQCDRGIVCSGNEKTSGYGMVGLRTSFALQQNVAISQK